MTVLRALQRSIESLHDVDTALDVERYTVDNAVRSELPGAREGLPEQFFIQEVDGHVDMALYIAPHVTETLTADDPHDCLHDGNFAPYCIALEGVSHFVFLVYRARLGRPVSPLELEIQAEVDKFVSSWILLSEQGHSRHDTGVELARRMFDDYTLHDDVPEDHTQRYHVASRVAARYCRELVRQHSRDRSAKRLTRSVRGYYRRGLADKMRLGCVA